MDKSAFVKQVYDAARSIGLSDTAARVAASQAALESNYGKSAPGNNFFGIKGKGQVLVTKEGGDGTLTSTKSSFRTYPDMASSVADWAKQMQRNWPGVLTATNYNDAIYALNNGRLGAYATDGVEKNDPLTYQDKLTRVAAFLPPAGPQSDFNTMAQANINAANPPPLPIPRPQTPGMKPLAAPAPLTAPMRSPWDIPGVVNVNRELALKPDSSGMYPTMASGYIHRAMDAEKQKIAPAIQQATQTVGNAATSAQTAASQAIDQGKAALGNAGSQAVNFLGGLFGGQPNPPPRPPLDIPTPGMTAQQKYAMTALPPQPMTPPLAPGLTAQQKYAMSALMGSTMPPLPAPTPLVAPPALAPLQHRNVPSAPNWQPTIAPPVQMVQIGSGRMAPVNAQTPHGGTVQSNGSIQFKNWSTPGPSQPQKWWQINSAGGTV